jgi:exopolysaccharide biosynthesis polyprenyl glycosylphosphotransferase
MTEVLRSAAVPIPTQQPLAGNVFRLRLAGAPVETNRSAWARQYVMALLLIDIGTVICAVAFGYLLRFGTGYASVGGVSYVVVGGLAVPAWLIALQISGAYELRHLSVGAEEYKRVIRGSLFLAGTVAVTCYVCGLQVARGFVGGVVPLGAVLLLVGRYASRRVVYKHRIAGRWGYRILAVGTRESVNHLIEMSQRSPHAGLQVIGGCIEDAHPNSQLAGGIPVVGKAKDAAAAAARLGVDVVALASSSLAPQDIRELSWMLEGTGRELVMAPGLTEVAGPRVRMSPVEGLPLMWVQQPQFTGFSRLVKRIFDILGTLLILLVTSPLFLALAVAIKVTSPGPVFFRQVRTGKGGEEFLVYKFRSMFADAEQRRVELMDHNENDGHLFKMRRDPRVTSVGRIIRRLSLDELPQLFNVLTAQMSLVGPRPLATIDSNYEGHATRRLLVRPGMTGLWQVSGRSDLSWDDAVRLDLYYVENWSLCLDLAIVARTVHAVLRGRGAY